MGPLKNDSVPCPSNDIIITLLVDLSPVSIRQNMDLLLELLLLFFGLFLQVVLIRAHGQCESVGVLLQEGGEF